jgi:hypothetical protein
VVTPLSDGAQVGSRTRIVIILWARPLAGLVTEAERHHPNSSFGWGNATVSLQTKKIKGLHENDFIMATKIDRIFARTAAG